MMLLPALGLGFAGSLHCAGMCGPIALAIPVGKGGSLHKALAYGIYHFGRISGYAILGFLFGTLGYGFSMSGFQQGLSIAAGVGMLIFIWMPKFSHRLLPNGALSGYQSRITRAMASRLKSHRAPALLGLGFFNGLLPCGLVYLALAGALASYDPLQGAAFMALFGLGTAPTLLLVAYTGSRVQGQWRLRLQKIATGMATFIAILFIIRGLGLGIPYLSPELGITTTANMECAP